MTDSNRRSFWSSIPGLLTGTAGILTAVVGLFTVLIQLDVIGKDNGPTTTVAGSSETTQRGPTSVPRTGSGGVAPTFSVTPTVVKLDTLAAKEATVTLRNTGSVAVRVEAAVLEGPAKGEFAVNAQGCTGSDVRPASVCPIKVSYVASARGDHVATLRIEVEGAADPATVQVSGSRLL